MKLLELAMALDNPYIKVTLIDRKSRRIAFEGTAEALLDFSGIDYRRVSRIDLMNDHKCFIIDIHNDAV